MPGWFAQVDYKSQECRDHLLTYFYFPLEKHPLEKYHLAEKELVKHVIDRNSVLPPLYVVFSNNPSESYWFLAG
jgi:hypothetical protein